jgi:hypothetical protein
MPYIISEPLPAFVYSDIEPDQLPAPVKAAVYSSHPDAFIEKVETSSFKGRIVEYMVYYRTSGGSSTNMVLNPDGSEVQGYGTLRAPAE